MKTCMRVFLLLAFLSTYEENSLADPPSVHPEKFGIRVVDQNGRGVPLVELKTTNEIRCVTDNAGWIAWHEPGLMNREVCWTVQGPGIEREKDGFGFPAFRAITKTGTSVECRVTTTNIATRVGRLTGQGLYRDSALLGLPSPLPNILEPGVMGQDSVQCVPFQGKLFWLWGDTNIARYPLGNFHTTCATSASDLHPEAGISFEYFTDRHDPSKLRKMFPTKAPGVVWLFGLMATQDPEDGRERLFAGFSRRPGLAPADEQGVAEFDTLAGHFIKVVDVPKSNGWGLPNGHAVRVKTRAADHILPKRSSDQDSQVEEHFYFNQPFAYCRVPATPDAICNPSLYESLVWDEGDLTWQWRTDSKPTTQQDEKALLAAGKMAPQQSRYQVMDAGTGKAILLHTASIAWNDFRKRFVLIGLQLTEDRDSPSKLGEVWYGESDAITGPWRNVIKIASHPNYSFYNLIHHLHFDREGGRIIYFEGTYTAMFSDARQPTARYDYNQVLYRLDLTDDRLRPAQ